MKTIENLNKEFRQVGININSVKRKDILEVSYYSFCPKKNYRTKTIVVKMTPQQLKCWLIALKNE